MIDTLIDKATGSINCRFVLAYWLPVLIAFVYILIIDSILNGSTFSQTLSQNIGCLINTQNCELINSLYTVLFFLAGVTLLGYILQIFTTQIVRFYEGYWVLILPKWASRRFIEMQIKKCKKLKEQRNQAIEQGNKLRLNSIYNQIFLNYPNDKSLILPTTLGNILQSAEQYSYERYGMDSAFCWPRLWPLLDEKVKSEIDDTLIPMIALLNFNSLILIFSFIDCIYTISTHLWSNFFTGLLPLLISVLISWVIYRVASTQAINYGLNIRSTIDLNRFKLLESRHQSLPENITEEIIIWDKTSSMALYWRSRYGFRLRTSKDFMI